jgi:hypothetical protein
MTNDKKVSTATERPRCVRCRRDIEKQGAAGTAVCRWCFVIDEALDAFWEVVARRSPAATRGDVSPLAAHRLQEAAEDAVEEWITNNVPGADHGQAA